ncbi:MAG: DUF4397 domain-containing protein [Dermatophilaceae bacterium]|nr:DUF4397 domain-containing protein [Intrasporangiaceae bacterium]
MRKTAALALAGGLTLAFAAPALADGHEATVFVLHAVPDATVDVYVNGDLTLDDFTPGTLTDGLKLPAGDYDLKVVAGDAENVDADAIIEANGVTVPGGANITVVAHLDATGTPILTPFVNDNSATAAGEARITVRHTAAAPAVDVRANGEVAFPGLENPNEASADLAAGTIKADVVLAGTDTVAIGPADVNLAEGTHTIVYAWGSAEGENLALAVQSFDGLHSSPDSVPSGTGGQSGTMNAGSLAALAALGAAGLAYVGTRRRVSVDA